jgi:hypothetical protein
VGTAYGQAGDVDHAGTADAGHARGEAAAGEVTRHRQSAVLAHIHWHRHQVLQRHAGGARGHLLNHQPTNMYHTDPPSGVSGKPGARPRPTLTVWDGSLLTPPEAKSSKPPPKTYISRSWCS